MLLLFVRFFSTISRQPAGRFKPNFACGRSLVPDVSYPLLGVSSPDGRKKEKMTFSLEVNGELYYIFVVFERLSQQRVDGSTPNFICVGTMSADVPLPCLGSTGPWGAGGGGLKTQKLRGLIRAVDSYHFYFSQRFQTWFNM